MSRNSTREIPNWIETCYEEVAEATDPNDNGITEESALSTLNDSNEISLGPEEAEYALSKLLDYGYFYEYGGRMYVTEP